MTLKNAPLCWQRRRPCIPSQDGTGMCWTRHCLLTQMPPCMITGTPSKMLPCVTTGTSHAYGELITPCMRHVLCMVLAAHGGHICRLPHGDRHIMHDIAVKCMNELMDSAVDNAAAAAHVKHSSGCISALDAAADVKMHYALRQLELIRCTRLHIGHNTKMHTHNMMYIILTPMFIMHTHTQKKMHQHTCFIMHTHATFNP